VTTFYEEINRSPSQKFKYTNSGGTSIIDVKEVNIPNNTPIKQVFEDLQQYTNKIASGGILVTPKRTIGIASKFGLKVQMYIGGAPFEFVLMPARDKQVFVSFVNKFKVNESHSYDYIVKLLDQGDDKARQERASAILKACTITGTRSAIWGSMTDEQIEASQDLIVLTQLVEPVRLSGIAKLARSHINKILNTNDHGLKFADVFIDTEHGKAQFVLARKGGVKKMKGHVKRPTNDGDQKFVDEAAKEMSQSSGGIM